MKSVFFYETKIGTFGIAEDGQGITNVIFGDRVGDPGAFEINETPLLKEAGRQLTEYARGNLHSFDLPLTLDGTEFEKRVWNALLTIPYGETRSYGDIAAMIGNPKACRAVGGANGRNSIPIIIPCHRVIGANGTLTGFTGGLDRKILLLNLEGIPYKA